MAATIASNIIFLPFRRTYPVELSAAIKQYISSKYDQHPDMFADDLKAIDKMRTDAIHVREPHPSGTEKLMTYAAQLVWIGGKFPIDIGVDFTWHPALGYNAETPGSPPISQNNIRFELANILYNLASIYSQLAETMNRSTTEGLKSSCNYFSLAAGVISYLKNHVVPDMRSAPPEDMDPVTLESLEQLLLAQSQECFWSKAVMDGLKDASIAKLAAKVSDYYSTAGDWGIKSNAISSEWLHHMTAKHHHFASAAQYRAACDALEKRKYGEEVARLRDSLLCVHEALKEARYINKFVLADLQGLKARVQEDLKRAEKDNDMIYLIPVPPKSELKTLDRANMATVKVPKEISDPTSMMGERGGLGRPLFAKLVPFAVHVAASIYDERRDRLVNHSIIDEIENMTGKLHELLQTLNLPASLQALEKPLGLPHNVVSHAEEIRQHNALNRINRSMDDITRLKDDNRALYSEGSALLDIEAQEDEAARTKYGTDRWSRLPSKEAAKKLYGQVQEIDGYLKSAANSDELVKKKFRDSEDIIRLLAGTDRDLADFVPSSRRTATTGQAQAEASRLRTALNEVSRLESRRRRKAEALREKAKSDDINTVILAEAARIERDFPLQKIEPANFEDLFARRLQRYDADRAMIADEQTQQEKLESKIREANNAFRNARRGDSSTKEREQALQQLESGYLRYKEVVSNLDVGRKFYNDLTKIVSKFRDECRTFAYQRRSEAGHMENDLSTNMAALNLSHNNAVLQQQQQHSHTPHQPQQHHHQTRQPHQATTQNNHPAHIATYFPQPPATSPPISAPQPTRNLPGVAPSQQTGPTPGMWTPDMGIKFGGAFSPAPAPGHAVPPNQPQQPQQSSAAGRGIPPPVQGQQWDPSRGLQFR